MNNKLIKRLLMTTALGAASFAGINEAAATTNVVNAAEFLAQSGTGSNIKITNANGATIVGANVDYVFKNVDINNSKNFSFTLNGADNRKADFGDFTSSGGDKTASFTFTNNAGQVISVGSIGNGAKLDAGSITFAAAGGTFEIKGDAKFDVVNIINGGNNADAVLALTGEKADIVVSKNQTVTSTNLTGDAKLTIGSEGKGAADVTYTSNINAKDSTVITNGTKNVIITGTFNEGTLSVGTTGDKITTTVTDTIADAATTNINFIADSTLVANENVGDGDKTAKIDFGGHSAKIKFEGAAFISEISNDENAEIHANHDGLTISATGEMNAKIFAGKYDTNQIVFSPAGDLTVNGDIEINAAKGAVISANGDGANVIFAGNITGATNKVVLSAENSGKITITNVTGSKEKPLTAVGTKGANSNINLAADSFSKAYTGGAVATGSISFGGDNDTTHTGEFCGSVGFFKTVGQGTVTLDGAFTNAAAGVRLHVGANTNLTKTFDLNANGSAIKFTEAVTLHATAGVGQTNPFAVDFDNRKATLELSGADSKLGEITNGLGSTVKMSSDHNLKFNNAINTANGAGLNVDASAVKDANKFVEVKAAANLGESVFGTVNTGAGSFNLDNNAGFVTVGNLISPKVKFGAADQTLVINEDFKENKFGADIDAVTNKGNLILDADGTVNSKKLELAQLTINENRTVNFDLGTSNGNYKIDDFRVKGTASLASNLTNEGALNVDGTGTLNLNGKVFTSNKAANFLANSTLQVSDGSSLIVKKENLTFADGASVSADKLALKRERTVIFGKTSSGKIDGKIEKIDISPSENDWVIDSLYTLDANGNKIERDKPVEAGKKKGPAVAKADAKEIGLERALADKKIKESLKDMSFTGADKQIADQFVANTDLDKSTGDAREFFVRAGAGNADAKRDAIKSLKATTVQSVLTGITAAHQAAISTTASVVNSRMAVAASDDLQAKAGFWVRGTYGVGNRSESAEFSTNSYDVSTGSGTVGAEIVIAEDAVLGVAGTYAQTTVDYKGSKDGDKDKFKSMIGSVYATGTLSNNVVLNGSLMFANSDIDSTVKPIDAKVTDSAKTEAPKVTATSYSGTALVGYKVDMSGFSVTPLVGARFGVFNEPARKTASNLATASELSNTKVDIAFGLSASGEVKASDMVLVPELHGFGYYNVKGDKTSRSIVLDGLAGGSALTIDEKAAKFQFNVGASLTAKVGMVDYGVGVDGIFEDKSWFAQGSIKLRVSL